MSLQPAAWPEPDPQIAAGVAATDGAGKTTLPPPVLVRDRLGEWLRCGLAGSELRERLRSMLRRSQPSRSFAGYVQRTHRTALYGVFDTRPIGVVEGRPEQHDLVVVAQIEDVRGDIDAVRISLTQLGIDCNPQHRWSVLSGWVSRTATSIAAVGVKPTGTLARPFRINPGLFSGAALKRTLSAG